MGRPPRDGLGAPASCLAKPPLIFCVLLLDKGGEPGMVNTAWASEHLGLRCLIALATPRCAWRPPPPRAPPRPGKQAAEKEMLWICLLCTLTRRIVWFQSSFALFLCCRKGRKTRGGCRWYGDCTGPATQPQPDPPKGAGGRRGPGQGGGRAWVTLLEALPLFSQGLCLLAWGAWLPNSRPGAPGSPGQALCLFPTLRGWAV